MADRLVAGLRDHHASDALDHELPPDNPLQRTVIHCGRLLIAMFGVMSLAGIAVAVFGDDWWVALMPGGNLMGRL
jgi:hypothetical protein